MKGIIYKALSGFYYIYDGEKIIETKARGKFKHELVSPLVGDAVEYTADGNKGIIDEIYPRKNSFIRPAVANIDTMVYVACNAKPVTDPFLIDRVSVIAESCGCEFILCINKSDLEESDNLSPIYKMSDITTIKTSAQTGEGIDELIDVLRGKVSVLTGNSGAGKSSILNKIIPGINIKSDEISDRLGRGKHTTRHVELYKAADNTFIADTPGFASFDIEMINHIDVNDLQYCFTEFNQYIGKCRFNDCRHVNEPGCAVINAVTNGNVSTSRHNSYVSLYDVVKNNKLW